MILSLKPLCKLRQTTRDYNVSKFAPRIGVVDRLGIKRIKRVVCKEGLDVRPQRSIEVMSKPTKMLVYS